MYTQANDPKHLAGNARKRMTTIPGSQESNTSTTLIIAVLARKLAANTRVIETLTRGPNYRFGELCRDLIIGVSCLLSSVTSICMIQDRGQECHYR